MPISFDVNNFWRPITGKKAVNPVNLVAKRFLEAFHDHGVNASQIPRLLPQIKLDDLKSAEALLAALTPEILDQTAKLFGIRSQWLEGVDEEIYEYHSCYKQPELLFELLAILRSRADSHIINFPLRVLSSTKKLDFKDDREQLLVPVLVEKITELLGESVYRYYIFNDGFDWGYTPGRIQLKAIARMIFKVLHTPVSLFVVSPAELQNVLDRKTVPRKFVGRCLITNPSLEDFALTKKESGHAKEVDELPEVLRYIEEHKLESLITKEPPQPIPLSEPVPEAKSPPEPLTPAANTPKSGKRADTNLDLWEPVRAVASMLWADSDSLSIADAIRRIKKMSHLKASVLTASAIRKHIVDLAHPNVRGKSGRKPNKPS